MRRKQNKEKIKIVLTTDDEYIVVHGEVIAKFPVRRGKSEKETKEKNDANHEDNGKAL